MAVEVRLPQFGMGMQEGVVVCWYKHEGDPVEEGEVLAEVEAAKTTEELEAPASGVLERILVPEGVTVPVHELLAVVGSMEPSVTGSGLSPVTTPVVRSEASPGDAPSVEAPRVQVVPRARLLARELGLDLSLVTGTGPGGRVLEEDVRREAAADESSHGAAVGVSSAASPGASAVPSGDGEGESVPLSGMRATVAARMHASLREMAQLTLVTTADVTDLVALRQAWEGPDRPTYADAVVRAAAVALRSHRRLNATVEGDRIRILPGVHVGLAVAVDDGLVVPVVRDADRMVLGDLAVETSRLARMVRSGSFGVSDVTGGTFTVTSLGGQGIDAFTPIVNPPEVAILGVGRVTDQPAPDGDGVRWRKVLTLSLTVDHRAVDGAPGAAFLQDVVALLGDPRSL